MLRNGTPTRNERLIADLTATAIDLQALANRLRNGEGIPLKLRDQAGKLAEAGREVCLVAVAANDGKSTKDLVQFYGQFLGATALRRSKLDPLEETGMLS